MNKVGKILDEAKEELMRAKEEEAETKNKIAWMQEIIKMMMNVDTRIH